MFQRVSCKSGRPVREFLTSHIWSAAWLREAEVEAARKANITLYELMQRAAQAAYDVIVHSFPDTRHWLVLCGSGNNGGDGFEIARMAACSRRVTVVAVSSSKPLPTEAATALSALKGLGKGAVCVEDAQAWLDKGAQTEEVDLIVDGLLGIGMNGPPRGLCEQLINIANSIPVPRVAIDIPSGLNAETGDAAGACILADLTVTFITLKPGILTGKARDYVGQVHINALQLENWLMAEDQQKEVFSRRLECKHLLKLLPKPKSCRCIHKGANGRLLIIGGDTGFGGAVIMAAEAALVAGSGLVRVLTRSEHISPLLSRCPEVMACELTHNALLQALDWASCVAIGPGLGQEHMGRSAVRIVEMHLKEGNVPSVWDADALNILAQNDTREDEEQSINALSTSAGLFRLGNRIITPHSGEAARLLQCSVSNVERDRFSATEMLVQTYGGVALLKGPGTVLQVAEDADKCMASGAAKELLSQRRAIVDAGNSGMATGGSGDVLTGVIAGLLAQGFDPWHAACAGCLAHAAAGDLAVASRGGERGLRATDLITHLPACFNPSAEVFD
ncbi:putative YjeF related protein N terminus Carbohydrate kinase [Trypanosoma vivax]|uniref:Bifunctional NAD(P)H-hydrate repair enzyme n=1 Tax=Trypanosoma vivax (strain Y486) TaxID=1055687 RepID=G0TYJ2_TRYVY|nr:hypothetical protein TRVL_02224 [Trypanosoma vivax]KAH8611379.1 putative YjeF related protein N terminus Carbohydrate kinase [Trypanosoma vivax]CCC49039.1 conserved hypothetical protein [Trypanosoma vivax Y486]